MSHNGIKADSNYDPKKIQTELRSSEVGVNIITYPAGEVQLSLSKQKLTYINNAKVFDTRCLGEHQFNVMAIAQAADIIRHNLPDTQVTLNMPYMPYSRQDRRVAKNAASSLKVFTQMVNAMGFARVSTVDPHSDVCEALFGNLVIESNTSLAQSAINDHAGDEIVFLSPDAGAEKKIYSLVKSLDLSGIEYSIASASKVRNVLDGEILHTSVPSGLDGMTVFIVDDICDGGRTFIEIAKALPESTKTHLVVTHGIFSKGQKVVFDHFESVTTTDSFPQIKNPKLTVIGI